MTSSLPHYTWDSQTGPVLLMPGASSLPKRNYGFEKRQKEIKRQQKKEEKKQKKLDRAKETAGTTPDAGEPTATGDQEGTS